MTKRHLLLFAFILTSLFSYSQSNHLSGFGLLSLTYKFDKNWYAYTETQGRSIAEFTTPDYYEIKGGAGYNLNGSNQIFLGLGRYVNYTNKSISREELRFWLQYVHSNQFSKLKLEQRIRAEKRFFHNPKTDVNTNTERFRYRLNAILPLGKDKIQANTFFVNAYDEIFLSIDKPVFPRNRIFAGGGYQVSNSFGVALGYLFQRDFNTVNTNLHFLFCGLNFTIDKSKKDSTIQVPSADHD